jgi:hypothetical protein
MAQLVATNTNGFRAAWDNGETTTPASSAASQAFAAAIAALRKAEEQGTLVAENTNRKGSYQGTNYQTGQLPTENHTMYIQLGEGESLWTVAENLGLKPEGWWQLVSDNPQFEDPDKIATGAPVAVDVSKLPEEVQERLRTEGLIDDNGNVRNINPKDTGAAYGEAVTPPPGYVEPQVAQKREADAVPDLTRDLKLMTPEQRSETMLQILGNPNISEEDKKAAVKAYLEVAGQGPQGTSPKDAQLAAAKSIDVPVRYSGTSLEFPYTTLIESVAQEVIGTDVDLSH